MLRGCLESRPVRGPGLQGCRNCIVSCRPRALTRRFGDLPKCALNHLRARRPGVLCLLALLCAAPLHADTSLSVGSAPAYPGSTVSLPALLKGATNAVAAQFDLSFNENKVTSDGVIAGASLADHTVKSRLVAPGVRRVLIYSLNNSAISSTNRVIASLAFTLSPTEYVGSGPLAPGNVILADAGATPVTPITLNSGQIFVRPANLRPDGVVDFFLPSEPDLKYLIQATTNFVHWENILTNVAIANFMALVDMDGPNFPYRFYRSALFDAIIGGQIGGFFRSADGTVNFRITGLEGRNYTIQASTDLVNWTDTGKATVADGTIQFTDPNAAGFRQRFYRLKSAP